jgi:Tol biopolymer transport system component
MPTFSPHRIVFVDPSGNVSVATEVLGAEATTLTADGDDGSPRWSPDGSEIAFIHRQDATGDTVQIMAEDGSGRRTIYGPVPGLTAAWSSLDNVRWSHDACTLYVIVSGGPSYDHHIHGEPLCGGQPTDMGIAGYFAVSITGATATAWSQSATPPHIDISEPNGSALTIADYGPLAFSSDGTQLAVLGDTEIRIYDLTGSVVATFAVDSGYSVALDWSNDGQRLIFEGNQGITVLSLESGAAVSLFAGSEPDEN